MCIVGCGSGLYFTADPILGVIVLVIALILWIVYGAVARVPWLALVAALVTAFGLVELSGILPTL